MISTCISTQEMAQSYTPSDQNLFETLRILGLIKVGERLLLTSPCGITSQCTGTQATYGSPKHKWASLRITATAAEKASWRSFIWGKNTFPSRTNWRTNSVLAAVSAKGCWTQGNAIAFSLFWCFQTLEVFCPLILNHRECRLNIN